MQTAAGYVLHVGSSSGSLSVGDEVTATIDDNRRARILPNHTFTHILNFALREVGCLACPTCHAGQCCADWPAGWAEHAISAAQR